MSVATYFPADFQLKTRMKIALAALDTKGGVVSLANPFNAPCLVTRAILDVTTKSTGVCTLDLGVDADGETGSDTLLDGIDVGTAVILTDNLETPGTNGQSCIKWTATQYVVASMASGAAAGVAGYLYLEVARL